MAVGVKEDSLSYLSPRTPPWGERQTISLPSPSSPCGGLRGDKSVLLPLALPQGRGGGSAIRMEIAK